jgi:hypothetical protein
MLKISSKQSSTLDSLAILHEGQHWTAAADGTPEPDKWDDHTYSSKDGQQIIRLIGHVSYVPPIRHDPVVSCLRRKTTF